MKKIYFLVLSPILVAPLVKNVVAEGEIHMKLIPPKNGLFLLSMTTYILLGALAAFILVLLAWFSYRAWRSRYAYCTWCNARNQKNYEFCVKCGTRLKTSALTKIQKDWFSMFGWTKNPFTLDIVLSKFAGRQAEVSLILEKLNTLSGHILIIGGGGTGKTMLLRWLEKFLKNKDETIYIPLYSIGHSDLIALIARVITKKPLHDREYSLFDLKELCERSPKRILLLLDDMHELKGEYIQLINMAGNLPNVSLVMAGRPEVREGIKRDLPEVFNHIVESILLVALTRAETEELIRDRIAYAGGKKLGPFTAQAIDEIHIVSFGIPQNILKICDWAVAQAVKSNAKMIDRAVVEDYMKQIKQARPHVTGKEGG